MLELVKLALRITEDDFDPELELLIDDCLSELTDMGIIKNGFAAADDPQIVSCVVFYCKQLFGENDTSDKWERIYRNKVSRLMHTSGYGLQEG